MTKRKRLNLGIALLLGTLFLQMQVAKANRNKISYKTKAFKTKVAFVADTLPPADVMEVISTIVYATDNFNIEAVANLYTPNALVADDEPPYSWNGPTAGVQWVNAIEKACKENSITKLKGTIGAVAVFQQNGDNIYLDVPVSYNGNMPGKRHFSTRGTFNFVLRLINGKWMVKSQVWLAKKGSQ